jgi:hypothetical protein
MKKKNMMKNVTCHQMEPIYRFQECSQYSGMHSTCPAACAVTLQYPGITRLINLYFKNLAKSALKYSHLKLVALLFDNVMAKIKTTIKNFTRNRSRSLRPFSSHSDPWHRACTRLNFWETGESIISCGIKRLEAMNPPYNWKIILLKKRKVLKQIDELTVEFRTSSATPGLSAQETSDLSILDQTSDLRDV